MPRKKKQTERTTALCYVRQSQTIDESDTNSPERQRANIQVMCDQQGWIPEWYEDAEGHKSGRSVKNRQGWLALEKRLSDKDVIALVANDLSRLHRKGWRIGNLLDLVDGYGIHLVLAAPNKQIDFSSPQGRAVAQLSAIFDEWYAEDISQRAKDSVSYRKNRGITIGIPPFGTKRDETGQLTPSEKGAWLLSDGLFSDAPPDQPPQPDAIWRPYFACARLILETYSTNKYGFEKIAYKLREEGWAFRDRYDKPRPIHAEDIRRVVSNWAEYGGVVFGNRARERDLMEYHPDNIDLDSDKAVFPISLLYAVGETRIKRTIRSNKDHGITKKAFPYPLAGMVRCAHCEKLAHEQSNNKLRSKLTGKKNSKGRRRYRHKTGVTCGCTNRSVMAQVLEDEVGRLLELLTVRDDQVGKLNHLALSANNFIDYDGDNRNLEAECRANVAKAQKRLQAAKMLFLDGDLSREEYLLRKEQAEREIDLWESQALEEKEIVIELAACVHAIDKISKLWKSGDAQDKQGMAKNIIDYIVFDLDTHRITDFRLKPWADRFITVRSKLYEDDSVVNKNSPIEFIGEGNDVAPTGLEPVSPP